MKIVNIIESIDSSYGGPAVSLPLLVKAIRDAGVVSEIWSVNRIAKDDNELVDRLGLPVTVYRATLFRYFSLSLALAIFRSCIRKEVDIFHFHSVWSSPTWIGMLICRMFGVSYVLSPRSSLYKKSLKKRRFLKGLISTIFLKRLIAQSGTVHCTDEIEEQDVLDFCTCRTFVLPHGVEMSSSQTHGSDADIINALGDRNLLYFSRIHRRKNLQVAIEAFFLSELPKNGWKFIVAGPVDDPEYMASIRKQIDRENFKDSVYFAGMVVEPMKSFVMERSDVFILLSEFENFGMSISEALCFKNYLILSENTPWDNLEAYGVGQLCKTNPYSARDALNRVNRMFEEGTFPSNDRFNKYITENCLTWEAVAKRILIEYESVVLEY